MFTGIVTDVGQVLSVQERGEGLRRLAITAIYDPESIAIGASICCSGVCMTAVEAGMDPDGHPLFSVDAAAETLRLTTVGDWVQGRYINLERSLKVGDELGRHLVSGHVDGLAELIARVDLTGMARLSLRVPKPLVRFIAQKGSVALDGVSLTVNSVVEDTFSVLIIPHTLSFTTLGALREGDSLNLEVDVMARYAARLMETR